MQSSGWKAPREIAGGKAQRLVPWQGADKLGAGEGERGSQPKAINSRSGAPQSNTGEEKERSGARSRKGRKVFTSVNQAA